jgi:hypothetical protein
VNGGRGCSKRAQTLQHRPICDKLAFQPIHVLQKIMTRKAESLATMRALTLCKYGADL